MRAARSDSPRITSTPAAGRFVEIALGQPLGPAQDRGERIVQFVRDAGDRLAKRRHLLCLEQLLIEIARLIIEPPPLADVAHERLDVARRRGFATAPACAVTSTQIRSPSSRRRRIR